MTEDGQGGQTLSVTFEVTMEDQLRFARHQMEHSPTMRRSLRKYRWRPAAISGLLGLAMLLMPDPSGLARVIGVFLLIVGAANPIVAPRWWRVAALRNVRAGIEASPGIYLGERTVTISDDGIRLEGDMVTWSSAWRSVERMTETDTDLMFWIDQWHRYAVPKSAFADAIAADDFADHARRLRERAAGLIAG